MLETVTPTDSSPCRSTDPSMDATVPLLRDLIGHLQEKRTELREEWARRILSSQLLTS